MRFSSPTVSRGFASSSFFSSSFTSARQSLQSLPLFGSLMCASSHSRTSPLNTFLFFALKKHTTAPSAPSRPMRPHWWISSAMEDGRDHSTSYVTCPTRPNTPTASQLHTAAHDAHRRHQHVQRPVAQLRQRRAAGVGGSFNGDAAKPKRRRKGFQDGFGLHGFQSVRKYGEEDEP